MTTPTHSSTHFHKTHHTNTQGHTMKHINAQSNTSDQNTYLAPLEEWVCDMGPYHPTNDDTDTQCDEEYPKVHGPATYATVTDTVGGTRTYTPGSPHWGAVCEHVLERDTMWDNTVTCESEWVEFLQWLTEKPSHLQGAFDYHEYGNGVDGSDDLTCEELAAKVNECRRIDYNLLRYNRALYIAAQAATYKDKRPQGMQWEQWRAQCASVWDDMRFECRQVWVDIRQNRAYMYDLMGECKVRGYDVSTGEVDNDMPRPETTTYFTSDMSPQDTTASLTSSLLAEVPTDDHGVGDYHIEGDKVGYVGKNPAYNYMYNCSVHRAAKTDRLREYATRNPMNAKYACKPHVGKDGTKSYHVFKDGRKYNISLLELSVHVAYYKLMCDSWAKGLRPNTMYTDIPQWKEIGAIMRDARTLAKSTYTKPQVAESHLIPHVYVRTDKCPTCGGKKDKKLQLCTVCANNLLGTTPPHGYLPCKKAAPKPTPAPACEVDDDIVFDLVTDDDDVVVPTTPDTDVHITATPVPTVHKGVPVYVPCSQLGELLTLGYIPAYRGTM